LAISHHEGANDEEDQSAYNERANKMREYVEQAKGKAQAEWEY